MSGLEIRHLSETSLLNFHNVLRFFLGTFLFQLLRLLDVLFDDVAVLIAPRFGHFLLGLGRWCYGLQQFI